MRKFTGEVDVRLLEEYNCGRRMVVLLNPVWYQNGDLNYVIPAGTKTDWASIPRVLWWLFPVFDKAALSCLLHDSLLETRPLSRVAIDREFRESMRCLGVSQWRRNTMWLGVRIQAFLKRDK